MRILLHKHSDQRHTLEIRRADGRTESVECETRSFLFHDLLHYAVEAEAGLASGFWGCVAAGRTLAEMSGRGAGSAPSDSPDLQAVELVVGGLTGAFQRESRGDIAGTLRAHARAVGVPEPDWLTPERIEAVRERLRRLLGRWKATARGAVMELAWPP